MSKELTNDEVIHRGAIQDLMDYAEFHLVDEKVKDFRGSDDCNPYQSIDDLPLTPAQKECVIEYLAWQLVKLDELATQDCSRISKTYDPMVIKGNEAHSYAFDLWDGGRHHKFEALQQLEEAMVREIAEDLSGRKRVVVVGESPS